MNLLFFSEGVARVVLLFSDYFSVGDRYRLLTLQAYQFTHFM
jgi:hypothetical protein